MAEVCMSEERLGELIAQAVKKGLGDHPCRYFLTPRELDHVIGMISDLGDGDLRRGVELIRENHRRVNMRFDPELDEEYTANHKWVSSVRAVSNTTLSKFLGMAFLGLMVATALGLAMIFGAKIAPVVGQGMKVGG